LKEKESGMGKIGARKPLAIIILAVGVVLLLMYAVLFFGGGRPSGGMLVVGLVDVGVGVVLLRRAMRAP
jgi:hypothetical protein